MVNLGNEIQQNIWLLTALWSQRYDYSIAQLTSSKVFRFAWKNYQQSRFESQNVGKVQFPFRKIIEF